MRIPTADDFRALERWGLIERPLAAIEDYSPERERKRADNDRHRRAREEYEPSDAFLTDTQAYYRGMERPIDRTKWAYLKRRKAWFQPPLGWGRYAAPGTSTIRDVPGAA